MGRHNRTEEERKRFEAASRGIKAYRLDHNLDIPQMAAILRISIAGLDTYEAMFSNWIPASITTDWIERFLDNGGVIKETPALNITREKFGVVMRCFMGLNDLDVDWMAQLSRFSRNTILRINNDGDKTRRLTIIYLWEFMEGFQGKVAFSKVLEVAESGDLRFSPPEKFSVNTSVSPKQGSDEERIYLVTIIERNRGSKRFGKAKQARLIGGMSYNSYVKFVDIRSNRVFDPLTIETVRRYVEDGCPDKQHRSLDFTAKKFGKIVVFFARMNDLSKSKLSGITGAAYETLQQVINGDELSKKMVIVKIWRAMEEYKKGLFSWEEVLAAAGATRARQGNGDAAPVKRKGTRKPKAENLQLKLCDVPLEDRTPPPPQEKPAEDRKPPALQEVSVKKYEPPTLGEIVRSAYGLLDLGIAKARMAYLVKKTPGGDEISEAACGWFIELLQGVREVLTGNRLP